MALELFGDKAYQPGAICDHVQRNHERCEDRAVTICMDRLVELQRKRRYVRGSAAISTLETAKQLALALELLGDAAKRLEP